MKLSSSSFGVTWSPPADVADLAGYNVTILGTAPNDYWETSIDSSVNSACFDVPTFSSDYRVSLRSIYTDNSYVSTDKEIISLKKVDNSVENKENCIKVTFLESGKILKFDGTSVLGRDYRTKFHASDVVYFVHLFLYRYNPLAHRRRSFCTHYSCCDCRNSTTSCIVRCSGSHFCVLEVSQTKEST